MTEVIDLDKLLPEPKKIRLSGKEMELQPGKLKSLIRLQKVFASFQEASPQEQMKAMEEVVDVLAEFIPDIKKKGVDISMTQLSKLVGLAYESSLPEQTENLAKKNMKPKKSGEKKTVKS